MHVKTSTSCKAFCCLPYPVLQRNVLWASWKLIRIVWEPLCPICHSGCITCSSIWGLDEAAVTWWHNIVLSRGHIHHWSHIYYSSLLLSNLCVLLKHLILTSGNYGNFNYGNFQVPSHYHNSPSDTMLITSRLLAPQFSSILTLCYLQMHILLLLCTIKTMLTRVSLRWSQF